MTRILHATAVAFGLVVLASGCAEYRDVAEGPEAVTDPAYCTYCHGSVVDGQAYPAPPVDTEGSSDTAARGVGAHAAHLSGGSIATQVSCETCHVVPLGATDVGHMDDPKPAEVVFTGLASAKGASPAVVVTASAQKADDPGEDEDDDDHPGFDAGATVTCENVYCHGATLSGGDAKTPRWNDAPAELEKFAGCGSCHGFPPPPNHPASTDCGTCHAETASGGEIVNPEKHVDGKLQVALPDTCDACHGYPPDPPHPETDQCSNCHGAVVGPDNKTFVDESKHRNGTVDVIQLGCDSCHGSTDSPAPPVALNGKSETTETGVGAHQSHLKASGGLSQAVACGECHVVPAAVGDSGHLDGDAVAEVKFEGTLATVDGAKPAWNQAAGTCSGAYCHGATLTGGANTVPDWTVVDGTQAACGNCHGVSPGVGRHPSVFAKHGFMGKNCDVCHLGVANDSGSAITDTGKHINGSVDVNLQTGTWDAANKTCNPACHGTESWAGDD